MPPLQQGGTTPSIAAMSLGTANMRIRGLGTYRGLFADWRGHPGQARDLSVTTTTHFTRKKLRVGSALQALALLGAGFTISAALTAPASAQDYTNVTASGRVVSVNGGPVAGELGRAPGRERVGQYVDVPVGAGSLK